jgi:hypothetical protein
MLSLHALLTRRGPRDCRPYNLRGDGESVNPAKVPFL